MKALLDTNILIDYLNGVAAAKDEIARYEKALISTITWMEVMVGTQKNEEAAIRAFLARFGQIAVNQDVAELAVTLRQETGLRLPDAIIWASAKSENALLVSRNSKDFPPHAPDVRMPYSV